MPRSNTRYGFRDLALVLAMVVGTAPQARADVIVAGYAENSLLRYNELTGAAQTPIVPPGGGTTGLNGPAGMTIGPDGNLYVSSQNTNRILRFNPTTGAFLGTFIDLTAISASYQPAGLRFGSDGSLYVSRFVGINPPVGSGTVDRFNGTTGAFLGSVMTNLTNPAGLTFGPDGSLYVSSQNGPSPGGGFIARYNGTSQSTFIPQGSGGLLGPSGLTFGPDGNLYVVDLLAGSILRYGPTGTALGALVSGPPLAGDFPSDLMFDRLGQLLVADLGSSFSSATGSVKRFNFPTGTFLGDFATGIFGASQLALTPVPEPSSMLLFGAAGAAFVVRRRLRSRRG